MGARLSIIDIQHVDIYRNVIMNNEPFSERMKKWLHLTTKNKNEEFNTTPMPLEIFNADQMENYGLNLALSHKITKTQTKNLLLKKLSACENTLMEVSKILSKKDDGNECFSPAREWLLDNFYLIQENIYNIRLHLSKKYGRSLPQLTGSIKGYPRIYDIALQVIQHSDGRWDLEKLNRFIAAYQETKPLKIGELWAIPIALRIALIERLSNAAVKIVADSNDRNVAAFWAERMIEVAVSNPKKVVLTIADMTRSKVVMSSTFIAELERHFRTAGLSFPISWIEQQLAEEGLTIDDLIKDQNKQQATLQVTISNSITGLRKVSEVNWRAFVENASIVEKILSLDPSTYYKKMDFETRNSYRNVIEYLANLSSQSEEKIATLAIEFAKSSNFDLDPKNIRYSHVGFYLIGNGLFDLKKKLRVQNFFWQKVCYFAKKWAFLSYTTSIVVLSIGLTLSLLYKASQSGLDHTKLLILGVVILVCSSQLAVALINWLATLLVKPQPLPKMDFSKVIPINCSTLVVVPCMLESIKNIESLIEALEIRFLGNQDQNLYFALLSDFNDATAEHLPLDTSLVNFAQEKIEELNNKYAETHPGRFFLFHRPRQWNAKENVWMGKERKRGKLLDLNCFIQNPNVNHFSKVVGNLSLLKQIKYIITLDSDTQLARESAQKLIGTMAHPLNIPCFNDKKEIIVEGYGILQPRIAEALSNTGTSPYVKLFGHEFGIDPYTRTVSNVYQDLFHEGSFIGKGIFDVNAFQKVLKGRFPDNCILSHDLLEGSYLRSGFISDVSLYEKSVSNYLADAKRRIRWIRGDWQLLRWLLPTVYNEKGHKQPNPLSGLSKLKLFDNLRRSLVPIAFLVLLGLNWTILPENHFWLIIVLLIVVLPAMVNTVLEFLHKPKDMLPSQHFANILNISRKRANQLIVYLACLPHEAWYSLNAILKTQWRLYVSKRHLLEWIPFDQVNEGLSNTLKAWILNMWIGPVVACLSTVVLIKNTRWESLIFASPLLLLWFTSPLIVRWLSQKTQKSIAKLQPTQIRFLHKMARKTWSFFETFMTDEDHWLPPDNYQETPVEALARRTSPTNIGLALLANLSAYDFGYITLSQLITKTSNTLKSVELLEKYHGHLYNWYSTETLEPLAPRYISTVDSGNLMGHLLTLRQGLLALPKDPLWSARYWRGLEDTWDILMATVTHPLPEPMHHFQHLLSHAPISCDNWSTTLATCNELYATAEKIVALISDLKNTNNEMCLWSHKLLAHTETLKEEIELYHSVPDLNMKSTLLDLANFSPSKASIKAKEMLAVIDQLARQICFLAKMDINFLYDKDSHLMTIGFNVDKQQKDSSSYDLLSSEARLGSFVAIAEGQASQESWFALGRLLVGTSGDPILISWSGSMFEYLMPLLVMPTYPGTLLDQTYHAVVKQQIAYAKERSVPWGISESGYHAVDSLFNYLYRAFGVPGLGLKRGLEDDLVIAPYASAMALMIDPVKACQNLQRIHAEHASGKFGFYEAIDYTLSRLPPDSKKELVRSFMVHHQGMIFLSLSYHLNNQPMQKRFEADPRFQATLILLQERIPKPTASYLQIPKAQDFNTYSNRPETTTRVFKTPNTRTPQVQLLSNGNYHLVLTQAGGGYSRWKDIALTRWREDSTCDNWGMFCFIRDAKTGEFCSSTYQPTRNIEKNFKVVFSEAHAEFSQTTMNLELNTEIVVSPEDDIELRRLRVHNLSKKTRTIECSSFAEIALTSQDSDLAQSGFNNLFVETEILHEKRTILVTRRSQDEQEHSPWLFHLLNVYTEEPYTVSFESDRNHFIGRGHSVEEPCVIKTGTKLSNSQGAVLDPIVSIQCSLVLKPNAYVILDFFTGISNTREHCENLIAKYQERPMANRIFELAWTHGQVLINQLNISQTDAQLYGRLASAIIYSSNTRRADPSILAKNQKGQSGLWPYSISGDLPIVLLFIEDALNIELVHQLIHAQAYWRIKGLFVDIVILNGEESGYRQTLQEQIMSFVTAASKPENGGNIVVRSLEKVPAEDLILLKTVARAILSDKRGSLKEQLNRRRVSPPPIPLLDVNVISHLQKNSKSAPLGSNLADLKFFNEWGGFSSTGDEYIIRLMEENPTPAPWANVLANSQFGSLVSESGQSYTWFENAHEFRLSPWENDPLQDTSGEAFYLRDDESGLVWSPTALPCRGQGDYQTRHGLGYSVFEHNETGIYSELWMTVALDSSVKCVLLKIRNDSVRSRLLSATGYVTWVLGDLRNKNAMYIVTEISKNGAVLAYNHYNTEFSGRTAFFDATTASLDLNKRSVTGDRAEFIGRNRSLRQPAGLERRHLSDRVGAGFDPCAAIQFNFHLAAGQSRDIVFTLGAAQNRESACVLVQRYQGVAAFQSILSAVHQYWQDTCTKIKVNTPDPALNILTNHWLLYQTLSSRLWGRSGYYQSGGAFGFRDQLQDVMALTLIVPKLFREHLLVCAAHQFEEGDVQHWWHPPQNRGVRTRCSDDYLWLPFALCHYIKATGDISILEEKMPFLQGRALKPEEESYYDLPIIGNTSFSLYEHAVRAIHHGLQWGQHGLPLIGSGDWNDGMNLVGKLGRGESVWLGFFLYKVLKDFAPLAVQYGDHDFASRCDVESQKLQEQLETHAWDGQWYKRAYFDDGTPLGSATNEECKIDSIAQSWSVLSQAADKTRSKQALAALYQYLVNPNEGLIKLLDPPFNTAKPNPGYIKGYVPGIRENGGQYTHAAIWAIMAFAQSGQQKTAWELLDMINPIHHGRTKEEIERYKIEPYAVAGDVYSVKPHTGRGGWSWYTGSAGWLYRLITETLLGLKLENGNQLSITPLLPDNWNGFDMEYQYGKTIYKIKIESSKTKTEILLDNVLIAENRITLIDDLKTHHITIYFVRIQPAAHI